jgi:hypothetical protein
MSAAVINGNEKFSFDIFNAATGIDQCRTGAALFSPASPRLVSFFPPWKWKWFESGSPAGRG